LRRTQTEVEEFAITTFRNVFESVLEIWSERLLPHPALSLIDSGICSDRDASISSSSHQGQISRQTPLASSEDESELLLHSNAGFEADPSISTPYTEDFSLDSVILNLFNKLSDDGSEVDFFNQLEA
jgi:hypothetical protein